MRFVISLVLLFKGLIVNHTDSKLIVIFNQALVHVSTAFNNLDQEEIKEEVIHSIANPEKLIGLVDCLDQSAINKIAKE